MNTEHFEIREALHQLPVNATRHYYFRTILTCRLSLKTLRKRRPLSGPQLLRGPYHRSTTYSCVVSPFVKGHLASLSPNLLFQLNSKFQGPHPHPRAPAPCTALASTPFQPTGPALASPGSRPQHTATRTPGARLRPQRELRAERPDSEQLSNFSRIRSSLSFPGGGAVVHRPPGAGEGGFGGNRGEVKWPAAPGPRGAAH